MRGTAGTIGIGFYLKKYDIDVIIDPAGGECTEPPAAADMSCQRPVIKLS